jgi:hypothetical protein
MKYTIINQNRKFTMTNDELWKGIIEDLIMEFLEKFYAHDLHLFDFSKPILFLDKELSQILPESEQGSRNIDKLIQISLIGGGERYILIHPEVHGYRHEYYEEREFIYYYRLFDRFKLPIGTLAIFTDTDPNYEPNCYRTSFLGTEMTYKYPTYKVLNQDPSVLAASDNLFDAVILTTYWAIKRKRNELSEEELLDLKLDLMRRLLAKNVDKTRIRKLLRFIKAYIRFEKPEINRIFEENYEELLKIDKPMGVDEILNKQAKEEGIAIGMEKGIEKGRTEAEIIHHNMLKSVVANMRNEGFSVSKIANLMSVSESQVEAFFRELDREK